MSPNSTATPRRFSAAMIAIHWATAILIVAVVVLAWVIPEGPAKDDGAILALHRSVGLAILALTVMRLGLRCAQRAPAEPGGVSALEAMAARATHVLLYVILVAMPLTGVLWATSRGTAVNVFGLFMIPPLLPPSDMLHAVARTLHSAGQYAVYAVVGAHVAAALFHLVVRRDGVMARMLPGAARLTPLLPPAAARPAVR